MLRLKLGREMTDEYLPLRNPVSGQTLTPCFIAKVEDDGAVVIDCPTQIVADWVKDSYHGMLREAISKVQGVERDVRFIAADSSSYLDEYRIPASS